MRKNILFLFVPIYLLISCKSDSKSYNDVVKEAAKQIEVKEEPKTSKSIDITASKPIDEPIVVKEPVNTELEKEEQSISSEAKQDDEKTGSKPAPKPKKPVKRKIGVMTFDNLVYEFGAITEGDIVKHDFYFTNTGSGVINVKNASATCGCTTPSYPFIPVQPGERGYIGVTYNSVGKSGVQTPIVTVVSNAKEKIMKVKLTGNVLDKQEESADKVDSLTPPN